MNKRKLGLLIGSCAMVLTLSACAPVSTHPTLTPSNITINLDMDSFNLSSLSQMPTPETLKFRLNLEAKTHLTEQATRTKDDLVLLWPADTAANVAIDDAAKIAANSHDLCLHP